MKAESTPIGARLIDQEGALDQQFASRSITPEALKDATVRFGVTQAELRNAHLKYHLETAQNSLAGPDEAICRFEGIQFGLLRQASSRALTRGIVTKSVALCSPSSAELCPTPFRRRELADLAIGLDLQRGMVDVETVRKLFADVMQETCRRCPRAAPDAP